MRKRTRWLTSSKEIAEVLRGDGRWKRDKRCVIRMEEMHCAGPVPDEGDNPKELGGKWGVDGTWIDPKLLIAGRKEEMEYLMKMGVFEVVGEKKVLRQRLQASHVEMGRQNER